MNIKSAALVALPLAAGLLLSGCGSNSHSEPGWNWISDNSTGGERTSESYPAGQLISNTLMEKHGYSVTPKKAQEYADDVCNRLDNGATLKAVFDYSQYGKYGFTEQETIRMLGSSMAANCRQYRYLLD